jgi:hypothetical protein
MPTVIDSLLIELGLDSSKYDAAQKRSVEQLRKFGEANEKTGKNAQKQAKDLAEGFTKVRNAIISIGAAVIGVNGFKDFLATMVGGNAALGRTSVLLGMNARDLDAWGGAVKSVGGTAEGFQATMQNIVGGLQKFKMGLGGEEVVTALARLGVRAKNGSVDLYQLADAIKRVKDAEGIQAALSLAEQLGMDRGTFQLMVQGSEQLHVLHDRFFDLSGVNEQNIKDAQELQEKWAEMRQSSSALANTLMGDLAPALKTIADHLTAFLQPETLGGTIATILSWFGNKEAKEAIEAHLNHPEMFHNVPGAPGPTGKAPAGKNSPRGIRNNNPGNIRFGNFAKAHGATGSDKDGFAVFPSMAAGEKALSDLLQTYRGQGIDTISGIVSKYAPSSENDTSAYIRDVSAKTGIGANQHLDLSQYAAVQRAIALHENGQAYAKASTVETNIGSITVQTQATDANGIARDMHTALSNNALISAGMVGAN